MIQPGTASPPERVKIAANIKMIPTPITMKGQDIKSEGKFKYLLASKNVPRRMIKIPKTIPRRLSMVNSYSEILYFLNSIYAFLLKKLPSRSKIMSSAQQEVCKFSPHDFACFQTKGIRLADEFKRVGQFPIHLRDFFGELA